MRSVVPLAADPSGVASPVAVPTSNMCSRCIRRTPLVACFPMFAARGAARGPSGSRVPRATLTLLFSSLVLFGITAGSASASSISAKRAEARAVEAQISSAQVQLEKQIERYDYVHSRLVESQHRLAEIEDRARQREGQPAGFPDCARPSLTNSYKKGGQNVVEYLLAAGRSTTWSRRCRCCSGRTRRTPADQAISGCQEADLQAGARPRRSRRRTSREQAAQAHEEGRIRAGIASLQPARRASRRRSST